MRLLLGCSVMPVWPKWFDRTWVPFGTGQLVSNRLGMARCGGHARRMASSEFELRPGPPVGRRHLFQNARLNAVGWAALAGASLVSAAVGAVLAAWAGAPAWIGAAVGLPLVLLVLVALDRRRSRLGHVGFGWTDDVAEVEAAADELRRRGVEVSVRRDPPSLTFRRRDQRVVSEVLGLPEHPLPGP
jgi:hypothetical protein